MDPEDLLEHASWLRRLAATLVGEGAAADDLVQETWVAALRRPPEMDRSVRPWLRRVVTNMARFRWRSDANRAAREQAAHSLETEATPSTEELLERHETQQLLARLVAELEEPYRATVLLRYAEGLTPVEIARRLDIPAATVRTRLKEGLDRLRVRLDAAHRGDRRAWIAALSPLVRTSRGAARASAPALASALALVLVAGLALVLWTTRTSTTLARSAPPASTPGSSARVTTSGAATTPATWAMQRGAPRRHVAGRVSIDGHPAANADVRLVSELSRTGLAPPLERRTGGDGAFDFGDLDPSDVVVGATVTGRLAAIQHVDLRDPTVRTDALELVVETCQAPLFGRVIDASGTPIAHARVLREDIVGTETDEAGNYELCMLPFGIGMEQLRVVVRADAYGTVMLESGFPGRTHHDFVLAPEATVTGRAVLADGTPASNVRISLTPEDRWARDLVHKPPPLVTASDADGRFHFTGVTGGRYALHGISHALDGVTYDLVVSPGDGKEVTLVMAHASSLRGRVLHAGTPVAGATISLASGDGPHAVSQADGSFELDPVPAGSIELRAAPYRIVRGGNLDTRTDPADVVIEVEALGTVSGIARSHGVPVPHARICASPGRLPNLCAASDEAGRYTLAGLEPGAWTLFAGDWRVGAAVDDVHFSIAAGQQLELDAELHDGARISGDVADARGEPVANAYVVVRDEHGFASSQCVTDAHGHFECAALPAGLFTPSVYPGRDLSIPFAFAGAAPAAIRLTTDSDHARGVRISVDARTLAISGTLVDATGAPVSDAWIGAAADTRDATWPAASPAALTDRSGHFTITDLARGTYALQARTSDGTRTLIRGISAGARDVTVVLDDAICKNTDLAPPDDPVRAAILHTEPAGIAARPPSRIVWNHQLELIGWTLPSKITAAQPFEATLVFKVLAPLDDNWKVFLHFDGNNSRIGLGDHEPIAGRCATSTWQPGTYILDRDTLTIGDPSSKRGSYDVWTGLFQRAPHGWNNLQLTDAPAAQRDANNRVKLATVQLD